jgi:hypothetical protein
MKVVYICHPLAGPDREQNRANAAKWVAWAALHRGVAPIADWIILSGELSEDHRELGLAIDLTLIERCDELWLCGPRISPGMQIEWSRADELGLIVRDFTHLGPLPPMEGG